MQHRRTFGHKEMPRKPLSPENKDLQRQKASCRLIVKFHDTNTWSKWSNEYKQPHKFRHIGDAVNEMFRIMEKCFKGQVHSAAIFDTRDNKEIGAFNKIYQFEKGIWTMVQPFNW